MLISRRIARRWAVVAILGVVLLEAAATFGCTAPADASGRLSRLIWLLIPLSPALVALFTPNPLCAIAAALPVAGLIGYAYYLDCIRPYEGGGASMVYLLVWFGGLIAAGAAALLAIAVLRLLGVRVTREQGPQGM